MNGVAVQCNIRESPVTRGCWVAQYMLLHGPHRCEIKICRCMKWTVHGHRCRPQHHPNIRLALVPSPGSTMFSNVAPLTPRSSLYSNVRTLSPTLTWTSTIHTLSLATTFHPLQCSHNHSTVIRLFQCYNSYSLVLQRSENTCE